MTHNTSSETTHIPLAEGQADNRARWIAPVVKMMVAGDAEAQVVNNHADGQSSFS